ncbi:hypothetical protein [Agromyces bauzanensis]
MTRSTRPSTRSPRPAGRTRAAFAAMLVLTVLGSSACATRFALPDATETPTPLPDITAEPTVEAIDPRCTRQFPGTAVLLHEGELETRPELWPEVPSWAVLCATEWENDATQVAWYATDEGISRAEIYRYYEHEMAGYGEYGRAETADGEISTGVFPPQHSFYIEATRDQYRITWSIDGDYAD